MIKIEKPFIENDDKYATLNSYITIDGEKKLLWFKVGIEYKNYLCYERGDAFLIAVLNYAQRNRHDIQIEAPITEELLYNIETYLLDSLTKYNPDFYRPIIKAEISSEVLENAGAVGTGISCGVDSLHVLASQNDARYPHHKVTHLTFNNVGSHGEGEYARQLYNDRLRKPKQFADEYGYAFVPSDSNLMDVIQQSHYKTHTYSSLFAIYCLQKLFSIYYYASGGYSYDDFTLVDKPSYCSGSYEVLLLPILSTKQLRIYSEGEDRSRMDKLKKMVDFVPSYKYLNVCLNEGDNCSKCEKCIRTLLGIDAIGCIDNYSQVFDIDYYKKNRNWYYKQMIYQMGHLKHDYFEIYPYLKERIPLHLRLFKFYYLKMMATRRILSKFSLYHRIGSIIRCLK